MLIRIMITLAMLTTLLIAQPTKEVKATDLPSISVIGNFTAQHSDAVKQFSVSEIEFAFQHYLYPGVSADVFAGVHKESNGKSAFEIEEAYVTFSDVFGTLMPNAGLNLGVGAVVGKRFVGVGKQNQLHPEQRNFVDRPLVVNQFFGSDHALAGEGAQLLYGLPVPFFSQLELGYWDIAAHEEGEAEGAHGVEYEDSLLSARLWNSVSLSTGKELELGFSYLSGNSNAASIDKIQHVAGIDVTYQQELSKAKSFKLQAEAHQAEYGEEGEARETQQGAFASGFFTFNPTYQLGARYGVLDKHGDEGKLKKQFAVLLTRQLTDTAKFRLQYNTGEEVEDMVYAQFIFGMGPHSHVLQ